MTKNSLLPDNYKDGITQATIISALKEYENPGSDNVINPHVKWNLHKAWDEASELLTHVHWRYSIHDNSEYELSASTEEEVEHANVIMAGIVAHQILNPESGISLRRIEHRKGGEMSVIISQAVAGKIKIKQPSMKLPGEEILETKDDFVKRLWDALKGITKKKA